MKKILLLFLILILVGCNVQTKEDSFILNIYSARHYDIDKDLIEAFKVETGITVNVLEGRGDELLERMIREKNNPQADLFITVGAESLSTGLAQDLFENHDLILDNDIFDQNTIGEKWLAITKRARVVVYDKQAISKPNITSYFDLTDPQWASKILVRSATSSYNIALLASLIQQNGLESASQWALGVSNNFARKPTGNDRDQARALVAGLGDLAIMNTYYLILMENASDPADREVASRIGVIFVDETHMNISYASILKNAQNKENAQKFIEFLLSQESQLRYMNENGEFPVRNDIPLSDTIQSWGDFTQANINYETLGDFYGQAVITFDLAKWD